MCVCVCCIYSLTHPMQFSCFPRGLHVSARVQVLLAALALLFALAAEMPAAFLAYTLPEGEPFFCVVARRLQDLAHRERSRNSVLIATGAHVACGVWCSLINHHARCSDFLSVMNTTLAGHLAVAIGALPCPSSSARCVLRCCAPRVPTSKRRAPCVNASADSQRRCALVSWLCCLASFVLRHRAHQ